MPTPVTRTSPVGPASSSAATGPADLSAVAEGRGTLRRGSRGQAVSDLQSALTRAGFPCSVDGDFGPKTEAAVRSYQARMGLSVDGVVGKQTASRLLGLSVPPTGPSDGFDPRPSTPTTPTTPTTTPSGPALPAVAGLEALPARSPQAVGGHAFLESTKGLSRPQREAAILQQVLAGNVPDFLRQFREITTTARGADGQMHEAKVRVAPSYLAIGSNADWVEIPMDAHTAQRIADATGCLLPTTKLVDEAWKQAELKVAPKPLPASAQMMSSDYYLRHDALVQQQLAAAGWQPGQLVAGNQKDLVISNTLTRHPTQVAIYGWHQANGKPIQPLSTVHEWSYADYSHGVRLVAGTVVVDGREMRTADVLADPNLAALLSSEGTIRSPRQPGV